MQLPLLGHIDPAFHEIVDEVVELLREVYRRRDGLSLPLSATGTAGMEVGLQSLLEPGDTVIVGVCGHFGQRIVNLAARLGANVVEVAVPFGDVVPNERLLDELRRHSGARLVCVVHAETSTGAQHPVEELAGAMRGGDALLYVDCVTSLGANELEPEQWGLDYCYSCTQKCLGAPPGMAPISLSERALERVRVRTTPTSFTFDLELLAAYWTERPPFYHHTVPILHVYALHEALRLAVEEGLEARWARHAAAGARLQAGLRERGLGLLADERYQLPQLAAVLVPDGVDGREVQARLLSEHGIEVGGALPGGPPVWRIGLMGVNATAETADRVLDALDAVLARTPAAARA
jgi:alanine-glyoxylate transaminase/serine-glyoxylate transaminase/serine-pyruvate transaminase